MFRIGLTGGIGSGKSEVASRFRELGALVIDADAVARELVEPGSPVLRAIVREFGSSVLRPDGTLDRRALADAAFSSAERRKALNDVTGPPLVAEIVRRAEALEREHAQGGGGSGVLVVDAALLVQWDVLDMFDLVLVVHAPRELRAERLAAAGFSEADVAARMDAQLPDDAMLAAADAVIVNDGSLDELRAKVDDLWNSLGVNNTEAGK